MTNLKRIAAFTLISGGIALGTLAVAQSATASPLNIVDNGDGTATGYWQLPATGTWPQSAINPGALCGVVQADVYPYGSAADKARTDALTADSTLTEGEDYGWPTSWTIKEYPACATTPSTTPSSTPETPAPSTSAPVESGPPTTDGPSSPSPSPTVSVPVATEAPTQPVVTSPPIPVETSEPSTPVTSSPAVPSKTTSPTPTVTSTSTSTPAAAVSNRNGTGTTEAQTSTSTELAYTGANTGPAIGGAVALLVGGLVMLAIGKKRKA